jgi:hypothetical protein
LRLLRASLAVRGRTARTAWRLLLLAWTIPSLASAAELWVGPDGNDRNAGTADSPFATVAAAQRRAREMRRLKEPAVASGATILIREGVYRLDTPIRLRPEDSGTAESPTIIQAAPGARPVLSGGVVISGWKRPASPLPRLPHAAQAHVWVAPVPIVAGRTLEFRQLWVGDRKATRARTPNHERLPRLVGWDRAKETATLPTAALAGVREPAGVELVVQQQWEIAILRIRSLTTEGERTRLTFHSPESRIEFEHPWPQPILEPEGAGAFYLVNAPEFLDAPGEWHHDRLSNLLVYWPREDEDLANLEVVAPALETLLTIEGSADRPVTHVLLRGLSFRHSTWLRPSVAGHVPLQAGMYLTEAYKLVPKGTADWRSLDNQGWVGRPPAAVEVRFARHTRFERCRFEQLAMNGLDHVVGAQDSSIEGCVFRDIGGNAILLGSFQNGAIETHLPYEPADARELCARLRVSNNVVTDAANEDWGCVGIAAGYVRDVAIEHNDVSHVSYTAISLGWGWTRTLNAMRNNRVHANHLHHYATRMCDTAGVYTLSAQPGTVVSENVIHSVTMSPNVDRPDHWFYLYLDEGSSHIQVRDNWTPEARFFENAIGPGNVWTNNGPDVADEIKARAGLQPEFRDLLE